MQVGVDAYHGVCLAGGGFESGQQGSLVAHVGGQVEAVDTTVPAVECLDERPGAVGAAVVDKEQEAAAVGVARGHEAIDHRSKPPGCFFDYGLFAVARNDDG